MIHFLHRLIHKYKLRKVPNVDIARIMNESDLNHCNRCSNCIFHRLVPVTDSMYCKLLEIHVNSNGVCDNHIYGADYITNKYKELTESNIKSIAHYREDDIEQLNCNKK